MAERKRGVPGRPPKDPSERRVTMGGVRVAPDTLIRLRAIAKARGLTLGVWLDQLAAETPLTPPVRVE